MMEISKRIKVLQRKLPGGSKERNFSNSQVAAPGKSGIYCGEK